MNEEPISILLVDDHPIVRAGYVRLIEQAPDMVVIGESDSALAAMLRLRSGPIPRVVLTDLSMPGSCSGIGLIEHVHAYLPACKVLVFSMYDSQALVHRALRAGASGFLSKSSAPQTLVQAIRSVCAGLRTISPDLEDALNGYRGDSQAALADLTEREMSLFALLAQGHPIGECAQRLQISAKTASNCQTALRAKLGVSTSAGMTHLALQWGVIKPNPG